MFQQKIVLPDRVINLIKMKNNFNFIRFFLAYSVMFNHFSTLTETAHFWPLSGGFRVKGFFIISGFLVMFSYLRTKDNKIFFLKRFWRIMPAYSLTIILCVIMGIFITSLSVQEYFLSPQLYSYFISNILTLNFINPSLPGVFENNPYITAVNGSLWTIKVELMLYLTIPFLFKFLIKNKRWIYFLLIYILAVVYLNLFDYLYEITDRKIFEILKRQFPGQMAYFISGIAILFYFDVFYKNIKYIFPVSIVLLLLKDLPVFIYLEPIALASLIICIAYSLKWLNSFGTVIGNASYGIFLSHYPVIQLFIYLGFNQYSLPLMFITTVVLCTFIGILSWKFVEKPLLYKPQKYLKQ